MPILRKTKKVMITAICGVKLIDNRSSQELMSFLDLENTLNGLVRTSGMRLYGHV